MRLNMIFLSFSIFFSIQAAEHACYYKFLATSAMVNVQKIENLAEAGDLNAAFAALEFQHALEDPLYK